MEDNIYISSYLLANTAQQITKLLHISNTTLNYTKKEDLNTKHNELKQSSIMYNNKI